MSKVSPFERPPSVEDEASEWLIRLDDENVSSEDRAEFERWIAGRPDRRAAFDRRQRDWHRFDDLRFLRDTATTPIDPDITARWARSQPSRGGRRPALVAAATALAATLIWAVIPASGTNTYATDVGARQTLTLADGSVVELNTDSELKVDFSGDERRLELTRGEAFFQVAHDHTRPFIVTSDGTAVRAVGTAFNVRRRDDDVEIIVTQGRVEVAHRRLPILELLLPDVPPIALAVGGRAEITGLQSSVVELDNEAIDRDLAWRRGMLAFKDEPLETIISELDRYTDIEVSFADDSIRQLKVGGHFPATDVDAVLAAMAAALPVRVERLDDKTVRLHRAEPR